VSPAATASRKTRIIVKGTNGVATKENTSASSNGTAVVQNGVAVHDSATEQPTAPASSAIPAPRFILQPARVSHKRKERTDSSAEDGMGKNGPRGRGKRHRGRRVISDSTDEDPRFNIRHGIRGRRIISDTSVEEPEQDVTEGAVQNGGPSTASNTEAPNTLSNIADSLDSIPIGEVACGTELVDMPLPNLELLTGEVVKFPYDEAQMDLVKDLAKQVRDKRFGIDWDKVKRTPTW
jgi:hypothetical protein